MTAATADGGAAGAGDVHGVANGTLADADGSATVARMLCQALSHFVLLVLLVLMLCVAGGAVPCC